MNDANIIVGMDKGPEHTFYAMFANGSYVVGGMESPEKAIDYLLNSEHSKTAKHFKFLWEPVEIEE